VQASAACDSRFHAPDANRSCIRARENFRFKKLRFTIIARSALGTMQGKTTDAVPRSERLKKPLQRRNRPQSAVAQMTFI
jgi:hypothetical protein